MRAVVAFLPVLAALLACGGRTLVDETSADAGLDTSADASLDTGQEGGANASCIDAGGMCSEAVGPPKCATIGPERCPHPAVCCHHQ